MEKKCQMCGDTFTVTKGNYTYCSKCKDKFTPPGGNQERTKPKAKETPKEATIAKIKIVGANNAHTEEIATDENVDMVNHPPHYQLVNGMESIDVIRAVLTPEEYKGWCKGNALKYQFRAGKKDPTKETEDYSKAEFYLKELRNGNTKSK